MWECSVCTLQNGDSEAVCQCCETARQQDQSLEDGVSCGSCQLVNMVGGVLCLRCGQPLAEAAAVPGTCVFCQAEFQDAEEGPHACPNGCVAAAENNLTRSLAHSLLVASCNGWSCLICSYFNEMEANNCAICETPQGGTAALCVEANSPSADSAAAVPVEEIDPLKMEDLRQFLKELVLSLADDLIESLLQGKEDFLTIVAATRSTPGSLSMPSSSSSPSSPSSCSLLLPILQKER